MPGMVIGVAAAPSTGAPVIVCPMTCERTTPEVAAAVITRASRRPERTAGA